MTIHLADEEKELIIESIEYRIKIDPEWSEKLNPILNELRLKYNHSPYLNKSYRSYICGCIEEWQLNNSLNHKKNEEFELSLNVLEKLK